MAPAFKEGYGKPIKKQPGEAAIQGLKNFTVGGSGVKKEKDRLAPATKNTY